MKNDNTCDICECELNQFIWSVTTFNKVYFMNLNYQQAIKKAKELAHVHAFVTTNDVAERILEKNEK